jgi:predicted trehalose synthase
MNFQERESARLNKQATALKNAGDMPGAIAVLRRIKALEGDLYQDTRLAKFLQQAGQLDAALAEIQWLLDHSQTWALALFGHQPTSVIQCQRAGWCARVHTDAALICRRAKQPDLQAQHELLRDRYASIRERLQPLAEAERRTKFAAL